MSHTVLLGKHEALQVEAGSINKALKWNLIDFWRDYVTKQQ